MQNEIKPLAPNRIELRSLPGYDGYAVSVVTDSGVQYHGNFTVAPEGPFPIDLGQAYVNALVTFERYIAAYASIKNYYNLSDGVEIIRVNTQQEVKELRDKLWQDDSFVTAKPVFRSQGDVEFYDVYVRRSR